MGYFAIQVKLSYEFTKAIPEDNPKFVIYQDFVKKFGVDGTTMVVGFQTDSFFTAGLFNQVADLQKDIKTIAGVTGQQQRLFFIAQQHMVKTLTGYNGKTAT